MQEITGLRNYYEDTLHYKPVFLIAQQIIVVIILGLHNKYTVIHHVWIPGQKVTYRIEMAC